MLLFHKCISSPAHHQVPFDTYFQVDPVKAYHDRVMTMESFFASETLTQQVWSEEKRVSFCYSKRQPAGPNHSAEDDKGGVCYAKSGNPFGPFWDNFRYYFYYFGGCVFQIFHAFCTYFLLAKNSFNRTTSS